MPRLCLICLEYAVNLSLLQARTASVSISTSAFPQLPLSVAGVFYHAVILLFLPAPPTFPLSTPVSYAFLLCCFLVERLFLWNFLPLRCFFQQLSEQNFCALFLNLSTPSPASCSVVHHLHFFLLLIKCNDVFL